MSVPLSIVAVSLLLAGRTNASRGAASPRWLDAVHRDIARAEYVPSRTSGGALQAPNRAHDLRTYFDTGGIRAVPRRAPGWEWRLRYLGIHAAGAPAAAPGAPAEPLADGERVLYEHEGGVTEWFRNDESGLEHGFTVACAPAGVFVLELASEGSLRPELRGAGLDLVERTGARALRYDAISARDAEGRELPASIALAADRSRVDLVIDAAGARFPVTVDPLATSSATSFTTDVDGAHLGISVSGAGDVNGDGYDDVIVGAPDYDGASAGEGAAFVYYGGPNGPGPTADWKALCDNTGCSLGTSVAAAGDVNGDGFGDILVGAPVYTSCDNCSPNVLGAFFVWYGSASGLGADGTPSNADFKVIGGTQREHLGAAVTAIGDSNGDGFSDIAVTSRSETSVNLVDSKLYTYLGGAGGPTAGPVIGLGTRTFPVQVAGGDFNGDGLADVLIGSLDTHKATVFFGPSFSGGGAWEVTGGSAFPTGVATAGDVNGDGFADVLAADGNGNVSLYYGASPMPSTTAGWTAQIPAASTGLVSVSTAGDVDGDGYADVLVGSSPSGVFNGAAYAWLGGPSGVNGGVAGTAANAAWTKAGVEDSAEFGYSVSCAGDVNGDGYSDVVVGAPYANGAAASGGGRAFLFLGGPNPPNASSLTLLFGTQTGELFGSSVAHAGDLNGDGYGDLVVGAPHYDSGQADEGRVFVYYGGPDGPTTAGWIADGNEAGAHLGVSVAGAGDVNGDGYDDLIVGADQYTGTGNTHQGAAFVWLGGASGLGPSTNISTADWSAFGVQTSAHLGFSVASAGDVNGDGYSDVIVGAPDYSRGQVLEGIALVWLGSPSGLGANGTVANAATVLEENQASAKFGISVASAGDVNGDGFSDVIVGASAWDVTPNGNEGAAFVYKGSPTGLVKPHLFTSTGPDPAAALGDAVTAGDLDGDGYSDVAVGAPGALNVSAVPTGRVFVYRGSPTGPVASRIVSGTVSGSRFGAALAAGDLDGDGFADLAVGAPLHANGQTDEGKVFVFAGGKTLSLPLVFSFEGGETGAQLGSSLAAAGDLNGDGFADLVVGAPDEDFSHTDDGTARVFYGDGAKGVAVVPQQRRAAGPLARFDDSDAHSTFRIRETARSPFGRARLQLETEAKLLGTPFDAAGTQLGAFSSSAVKTFVVTRTVTGLAPGRRYHWRARARYSPGTSPLQTRGPWLSLASAPARTEAMLRTLPCGGDVNGDGSTNVGDVFFLINALFAGGPQPSCGDVNADGATNVSDVFYLINFLFAAGPPPV
jgi:hypothetical protein